MADDDWTQLGVRPATIGEWRSLGLEAFSAALAQGDGYGPSSARHHLAGLRALGASWRKSGLTDADALRWHRAGFSASEAARWSERGVPLDEAARTAGRRMMG